MSESVGVGSCKARRPKPGSRLLRVRPWTGAALGALRLPGLLRVPADGVLQCSLAQRRLRRAPSEGAKSRLEMNVQSEFWRLPAGASAVAPAAPGYLPRCFQSRGGARRMPGITPSSGAFQPGGQGRESYMLRCSRKLRFFWVSVLGVGRPRRGAPSPSQVREPDAEHT